MAFLLPSFRLYRRAIAKTWIRSFYSLIENLKVDQNTYGFLKAVVGYMILNVGSAGLINTFRPILAGLNQKFHLNAVVIDPYFGLNAVNAALENIGLSEAAWF